uniref:Uncharacterized protein LOC105123474 isoform X1 n=1 Tax=Rhizophora mucronata TaxID=61149 RepID=A0A2P2L160_RHIMU
MYNFMEAYKIFIPVSYTCNCYVYVLFQQPCDFVIKPIRLNHLD